jgi:copper(I)-binding protein
MAIVALALMAAALGGNVGAQHDHGHAHGTPEASPMAGHEHGDHGDHDDLSMGAAYMTITNNGDDADRLLGITTDAAGAVEVHEVQMDNNVMQMTPLHDGLEIPAGEEVSLEPSGYHIMLIGLTESLIAGEEYEMTLTFEHAGEVTVTVPILRTEPDDNEGTAGPVEAGDLVIDGIWSRHAPKIGGPSATPPASPVATPAS